MDKKKKTLRHLYQFLGCILGAQNEHETLNKSDFSTLIDEKLIEFFQPRRHGGLVPHAVRPGVVTSHCRWKIFVLPRWGPDDFPFKSGKSGFAVLIRIDRRQEFHCTPVPDSLEACVRQPCPNIRPIRSVKPTRFICMSSSFFFFFNFPPSRQQCLCILFECHDRMGQAQYEQQTVWAYVGGKRSWVV